MENDKKVFLDINVVLDFLESSRQRHSNAVALIKYLTANNYEICLSEDMLTTIYYVSKEKVNVLEFLKTISHQWKILHFGEEIIQRAIMLSLEKSLDLEDTLQCLCAKDAACSCLITHDKSFYDCGMEIYSAKEFLEK